MSWFYSVDIFTCTGRIALILVSRQLIPIFISTVLQFNITDLRGVIVVRNILACCVFLQMCSVSLVYGDCTVGGVTFKLKGEWFESPKYFYGVSYPKIVNDKNGCSYGIPFELPPSGKVEVASDIKCQKQVIESSRDNFKEYIFPITDLNDGVKNTTSTDLHSSTQSEYIIRYMLNGELLAEYKGTFQRSYVDEKLYLSPYKGTFTFACGEVWSLHENNESNDIPEFKTPSAEAKAMIEKGRSAEAKASQKSTEENIKKNNEFKKKAKIGTKVRVSSENFLAQGLVIATKKNMVKVKFTEKAIGSNWSNVKPFEQWVDRSKIVPPQ